MKRIPGDVVQPMLLKILVEFDAYCKERDVDYFMCSGTMLGAVRHRGFIPWDDDIDLGMLWKDYSRLLDAARENPYLDRKQRYRILLPVESPNIYPFVKVVDEHTVAYERNINRRYSIGLWLDVFGFVGYPSEERDAQRCCQRIDRLRALNQIMICGDIQDDKFKKLYPAARLVRPILLLGNSDRQKYAKKMVAIERSLASGIELVGDISWKPGMEKRFPYKLLQETELYEFEGKQFPGPKDYDTYLSMLYGDYMQLPSEEERVRHDFELYARDGETADALLC